MEEIEEYWTDYRNEEIHLKISARLIKGMYKVKGRSLEIYWSKLPVSRRISMYTIFLLFLSIFALVANTTPTPAQDHPSLTIQKRSARTSNPGGCLEVQGTDPSSTQYSTLSSAVAALGSGTTSKCIFMWPSTYNERVTVEYGGSLSIYGYSVK